MAVSGRQRFNKPNQRYVFVLKIKMLPWGQGNIVGVQSTWLGMSKNVNLS